MRHAYAWIAGVLAAAAIGFMFSALLSRQESGEGALAPISGFPKLAPVREIAVHRDGEDTAATRLIGDPERIRKILDGLAAAPRSHFDDPEFMGTMYVIEIKRGDHANRFFLNDLRGTGSYLGGKIYPENPDRDEVWSLPADLVGLIAGSVTPESQEPPLLYLSTSLTDSYVDVSANREVDRSTVEAALKRTLLQSGPATDTPASYEVRWIDDRHFRISFSGLVPARSLRFSLDEAASASGESFRSADDSPRNVGVLFHPAATQAIRWIDAEGREALSVALNARYIQEVRVGGARERGLILHRKDRPPLLVSTATGKQQEIPIPPAWPEAAPSFGNDYGTDLLFPDRLQDEECYVAVGNRNVYLLDRRTGQARFLYASPTPIYGLTPSPDGKRAAVLVGTDNGLGDDSDVVLVSRDGGNPVIMKNAAPHSHGHGSLFPARLSWITEEEIAVPDLRESAWGMAFVRITDGRARPGDFPLLSEAERLSLEKQLGAGMEIVRYYREPAGGSNRIALEVNRNSAFVPEVWIVDTDGDSQAVWAGAGYLLGWSEAGILIADLPAEGYQPEPVLSLSPSTE
ncbi:hypothetical protein [Cohnella candidum]|uniref:Uncharacterized protein n=1 Tax=Cohnella candidum TaxID=2674991 RepID=A0A3G3JZD0_9BACL|nr:hypothetical protein [Cohnella candidum]AYQ73618.1 hypothetical protein EAV92_14130 [Cohnella candidum]